MKPRFLGRFDEEGLLGELERHGILPSPAFRFLSPAEQGRFDALRCSLAALPVAAASAAVETG